MRSVGLEVVLTLGLTLIAPNWLATSDPIAAAAQARKLPELLYTCPMHPEILEGAAGTCPVCKMRLEPVRIEESVTLKNSTIGPNVTIEAGSSIEGSTIANSILGKGVKVKDAQVRGSVVGDKQKIDTVEVSKEKVVKNVYSHVVESAQYLLLGGGAGLEAIGRTQAKSVNTLRHVDPFNRGKRIDVMARR